MAGKARRTRGGSVRKLPSGRWQVRVRDAGTGELVSVGTFATKADADLAVARATADQSRGGWVDPNRSRVTLGEYAERWLATHPGRAGKPLSPRTRERYDQLLRTHLQPLAGASLGALTPESIRRWYARLDANLAPATRAKAYRLLHAILTSAVDEELIVRNPATLKGAGQDRSTERPTATIPQVYALADAMGPRYAALVLVAAFSSLRAGELFGLRRRHVDLLHGTIRVATQMQRLADGTVYETEPKTGSARTVHPAPQALEALAEHLDAYTEAGVDSLVFTKPSGRPVDRHWWGKRWRNARAVVASADDTLPEGLRFHDLRHTGNTLAAATGASTRELMARMGHSTVDAAIRYQHATADRDAAIADLLGKAIATAREAQVVDLSKARDGQA